MLRRWFYSWVAMLQASRNSEFYITKYHAKPMEQLQCLLSNIALGLRRLAAEDKVIAPSDSANVGAAQPEERAAKVVLKISSGANRSSWCSCCKTATFIKTGASVRRTHRPCAIFLSRPLYIHKQCRRLLQSTRQMPLQPLVVSDDLLRPVDIGDFHCHHS